MSHHRSSSSEREALGMALELGALAAGPRARVSCLTQPLGPSTALRSEVSGDHFLLADHFWGSFGNSIFNYY